MNEIAQMIKIPTIKKQKITIQNEQQGLSRKFIFLNYRKLKNKLFQSFEKYLREFKFLSH